MNNNMTAIVSLFARYYHSEYSNIKIYNDALAHKIISKEEIKNISKSMSEGIKFFNPNYNGNNPLEWIVNNNLAPQILARSKFNQSHLINDIKLGLKQYVIIASGYDTSGYLINNSISVYELDKKDLIEDKIDRLKKAKIKNDNVTYISCDFNSNWIDNLLNTDYDKTKKTFCSLLGISYYLDKDIFKKTIKVLSDNIPTGSSIVFDYPNEIETKKEIINKKLAKGANEEMKSSYSYNDILNIAEEANMLIYEHLTSYDIDKYYFYNYNTINPNNKIISPKGVSYCLMVKR